MLRSSLILPVIALTVLSSAADAQLRIQRVTSFGSPSEAARPVTGGREVEFTSDGKKMIAAFYGSTVQLFDLIGKVPIGEPIGTAGDGEVGFVNSEIAYTADWNAMRLWDTHSGQQIGDPIPHVLREDTIIHPAINPSGRFIATRATMKSVQLWDVTTRKRIEKQLLYPAEVHSLRFSDDGLQLFVTAGGSLYAVDSETGKDVAGPITSGWQFSHFPKQQKLLTTEHGGEGLDQLVIRSTAQQGWPETHRSDLPGELSRLVTLNDNQVLVKTLKKDYTPTIFIVDLDKPATRIEVETNADRAFELVVSPDKRHWICSNIRNISCQEFGKAAPAWQKQVSPSGYDQHLYPFDGEHFVIRDKQENFGIYKIADGSEVWNQAGVKRFSLSKNKIGLCNSQGVEVWVIE
jgi:WD40 repeat protein